MNVKKIIIAFIILLIVIGGVVAGVILFQRNQDIRERADPATTIEITTSNPNPLVGTNFNAVLNIDTGENSLIIANLIVTYDVTKLKAVNVTKGIFVQSATLQYVDLNNELGKASFEILFPINTIPPQGSGILAVVEFEAIGAGTASIDLDPESSVGASDEGGQNVLIDVTPASVTIIESGDDPPPNPTVTPSPSPTDAPFPSPASGGTGGSTSPKPSTSPTSTPPTLPDSGIEDYTVWMAVGGVGIVLTSLLAALVI